MKVLLTNDDGYSSAGMMALAQSLVGIADVVIAAPMYEKSGASSSIAIHSPLRFKNIELDGIKGFAIDGSPTDSVKLALAKLVNDKIDLVISGINHGPNIATNVLYSGTVGGAIEAAIWGIPAIAISLAGFFHHNFESSQNFIREYILSTDIVKIKKGTILNINIPDFKNEAIKGIRYTTVSNISFLENYEKRLDPFDDPYFWLSDFDKARCTDKRSDVNALIDGYISISPINIDMTDHSFLEQLQNDKR